MPRFSKRVLAITLLSLLLGWANPAAAEPTVLNGTIQMVDPAKGVNVLCQGTLWFIQVQTITKIQKNNQPVPFSSLKPTLQVMLTIEIKGAGGPRVTITVLP